MESVKSHLTGLLMAINPEIVHVDYLGDHASAGRCKMLKMAIISYRNGQTRYVELTDSTGIREVVIAVVASCFQKSGGGRRAQKGKVKKR